MREQVEAAKDVDEDAGGCLEGLVRERKEQHSRGIAAVNTQNSSINRGGGRRVKGGAWTQGWDDAVCVCVCMYVGVCRWVWVCVCLFMSSFYYS